MERVWQNHFSPGSHFWPDELPFQMKNCNATLIALHTLPRRKKFHFPVEAIKSTEVAEHKWGSHNSNFQFFEVELQLLGRWWILLKRFPIHCSYIFNNFSSTFDVDKKWIIRDFFHCRWHLVMSSKPYTSPADTCFALFLSSHNSTTGYPSKM